MPGGSECFAVLLRDLLAQRDLSVRALAREVPVDPGQLSRVLNGKRRPSIGLARRCDEIFGARGRLFTAALDDRDPRSTRVPLPRDPTEDSRAPRTAVHPVPGRGARPALPAAPRRVAGDVLGRREVNLAVLAGGLVSLAGLPVGATEVLAGSAGRSRVDHGWLAAHLAVGQALAGLYRGGDPRVTLPLALSYADVLLCEWDRIGAGSERCLDLAHLVVGVHAQVGLWSVHADLPVQAHRYLATACELAAGVGDPALTARALGALSYLYSSAPRGGRGGDPRRALALLEEASGLAARADGFTRGWLATWRADQHAALGAVAAARADIDVARAGLTAGDDGQTEGFFSRRSYGYGMVAHLDSVQALVDTLGRRVDEGVRGFARVQDRAANDRRRAATHAHAALAHARCPDPDVEAACSALEAALEVSTASGYAMGVRRVAGVRAGFPPEWISTASVRRLDERLPISLLG